MEEQYENGVIVGSIMCPFIQNDHTHTGVIVDTVHCPITKMIKSDEKWLSYIYI